MLYPAWILGYFDLSTKSVDNPVGCALKQASKPCSMGDGLKLHYFGDKKINSINPMLYQMQPLFYLVFRQVAIL
ncbi:MAG: hypothetical protein COW15_12025 [Shewanella sp. CG12_big_fil_rev_8_21_14_0_65_47_15]|nr:MAG: hypothetical protein COW15_12025 [Shewanella sp. CG12_big_fil_rev_8_21_14_0_65_47_15]